MDFKEFIKDSFNQSSVNIKNLSNNDELIEGLSSIANVIVNNYKKGGCLYIAGNGGSAADAQHIAAELVARLKRDRTPIKAIALTVDTSFITAAGNDYGYEYIFSRQVEGLTSENDVFLAITTSGNSPNIIEALNMCKKTKATSVLLTGRDGGKCKELADHTILANGETTANIQEAHITIYHVLCFLIEKGMVDAGLCEYQ